MYSSPNIIRTKCAERWRESSRELISLEMLVGKPDGNRLFGRHGRRWECNRKMCLK